jgi:membrane protease YdiL (CAAX protease family)
MLLLTNLANFLAILCATWIAAILFDRRPLADYGFHFNRRWWLDFGFGLLLGAALMLLIFIVELAMDWVTITGTFQSPRTPFWEAIFLGLLMFILVGINEELLSRGYQLRNLAEGLNLHRLTPHWSILLAYLISSSIFGFMHLGNPNTTAVSTVNLIIAGLLLGLGYILTGELAIPIGLHITWNFFQGKVFGFPVSGMESSTSIIAIHQGGPDFWTGGAFGPEAGMIGLLAMLLGVILIYLWVRQRDGVVALKERIAIYQRPVIGITHDNVRDSQDQTLTN